MPRLLPRLVALICCFGVCLGVASARAQTNRLTPVGAEAAGNASGTIPPWTGGLVAPPAGWQAAQGYVDPFADEKPVDVITAGNVQQHKEQLAAGLQSLLAHNSQFRMPVYPTHRTAAYPARIAAAAGKGKADGHSAGIAYPEPRTGLEAVSNHLLRYLGGGVERDFDSFVVRASGDVLKIGFHDQRVYDERTSWARSSWCTSPVR